MPTIRVNGISLRYGSEGKGELLLVMAGLATDVTQIAGSTLVLLVGGHASMFSKPKELVVSAVGLLLVSGQQPESRPGSSGCRESRL